MKNQTLCCLLALWISFLYVYPTNGFALMRIIEHKVSHNDLEVGGGFGSAVDISESFAVVGAPSDSYTLAGTSDLLKESGSVYVYQRIETDWVFQQKLIPNDPKANSKFGNAVSLDNDYIIVGAFYDTIAINSNAYTFLGSAYIFKYNGEQWVQEAKLVPNDPGENYSFGFSVSISGNYAIVGCNSKRPYGAAYVFKNNNGNWEHHHMLTSGVNKYLRFGYSVDIFDDYAIVGADQYINENNYKTGTVFIFHRQDNTWGNPVQLSDKDGLNNDSFGKAVAINKDYALIGARLNDTFGTSSGMAYISKRTETGWSDVNRLNFGDENLEGYNIGYSVSIGNHVAIVGAIYGTGNVEKSGLAYVYHNIDGEWIKNKESLIASDGNGNIEFGKYVAISDNYAIVAAPRQDELAGAAYIYSFHESHLVNGDINNDEIIDLKDAIIMMQILINQ